MAIMPASFSFRRFRLGRGVNIPEAERQLGEGLQEQPQDILAREVDADLILTFEPQCLRTDVQVDPIQGVGEADTRARGHGKPVDRSGVAAPPRYDTQRIYSEVIPTPVPSLWPILPRYKGAAHITFLEKGTEFYRRQMPLLKARALSSAPCSRSEALPAARPAPCSTTASPRS